MSLVGFQASNHPQQVGNGGAEDGVDDRATDAHFFASLDRRFRFTVDVAASSENTKCKRFFDRQQDGLAQSWGGERVWCNPPYSTIRPWVEKAWEEWGGGASLIVMLLPANRTEQAWWQELVEPYRDRSGSPLMLEFLAGRLRFLKPNQNRIGPNERPPFGSCLLVWSCPELRFSSQRKLNV